MAREAMAFIIALILIRPLDELLFAIGHSILAENVFPGSRIFSWQSRLIDVLHVPTCLVAVGLFSWLCRKWIVAPELWMLVPPFLWLLWEFLRVLLRALRGESMAKSLLKDKGRPWSAGLEIRERLWTYGLQFAALAGAGILWIGLPK
jgi:hypothetical protein